MKEKPKISFVVTARNDNYGGNWINRINAFIKVNVYHSNRLQLPCELIFVEYNPVEGKENMYKELTVEKNDFLTVRFIIVPKEYHRTLPDNEKVSICEFIAKNIGIRRAQGDYIVATNPDTLYGTDLFNFFASNELEKNVFYRLNRKDTSISYVDPNLPAEKILARAERDVIKILLRNKTIYVSYREWFTTLIHGRRWKLFKQSPFFNRWMNLSFDDDVIHENAAGDFLLMHRDMWAIVHGYDEMTVGSGVLDSYILYVLYCKGFIQKILPYSLFHMYHDHRGVRYLASYEKFRKDAAEMLRTRKPYKEYSPQWGSPSWTFEEVLIGPTN